MATTSTSTTPLQTVQAGRLASIAYYSVGIKTADLKFEESIK